MVRARRSLRLDSYLGAMTVSHHSHSGEFCCHAKGTLEEVVQAAIEQGFTTFGLSEHVPRYRVQDLYPEEVRLPPLPQLLRLLKAHLQEELGVAQLATTFEAYVVEAHRLKSLHASSLTLLVGLETEYIDDVGLDALVALVERHASSIQYLVGSVHHCRELPIDFDKARFDGALSLFAGEEQGQFSALFGAYFDAQYTLLDRLRPEIVGHFDLCRLYYPDLDFRSFHTVWAKIERNIKFAVEYGALFELNASAFRKGWRTGYPGVEVFDVRPFSLTLVAAHIRLAGNPRARWSLHPLGRLAWSAGSRAALRQGVQLPAGTRSRADVVPR